MTSSDIKSALSRLYGQSCDQAPEALPLRSFPFHGKPRLTVLVSFDYDALVERLTGRLGMDVRNYQQEIRNDVVIFALDILASRPTCTLPDGAQLVKSLSEEVGRTRESLVLGAIPIKRELS